MQILKIILLFVLLIKGPVLSAQKKNEHAKADRIFENLGYAEAVELYRQGKLDLTSMERMAHCYRLNHDTYQAELWYAQIIDHTEDPLNLLFYAQACHSNGNYAKAKEFYLKYNQLSGGTDARAERLASSLDRLALFYSQEDFMVKNAVALNSGKLDFSPVFFEHGVVFASTRKLESPLKKVFNGKDAWTGDDFSNLYFAKENEDGTWSKPAFFNIFQGTKFHVGPLSFNRIGDQCFFTRNQSEAGWRLAKNKQECMLKIFTANRTGNGWTDAQLLDLGSPAANDAHPSLSHDGLKLYFASDREGGFGGMDLYVSSFSGNTWSAPANLGNQINTSGNEVFPFIYEDGTLYFASDGWGGLGGLDIFFSEKSPANKWRTAVNLGAPFNSPKDDFGYVLDFTGAMGYLTSAREGGAGKDDIYTFSLPQPQANKKIAAGGNRIFTISATDASTRTPLAGVKINVFEKLPTGSYRGFEEDFALLLVPTGVEGEFSLTKKRHDPFASSGSTTETYTTTANGSFQIELDLAKDYLLVAKKEGFQEVVESVAFAELPNDNPEISLLLNPANCLTLSGKVWNKRYGNPIPGTSVTLINLCTGDLSHLNSDEFGSYRFDCIPCNCDFIVHGTKAYFSQDNDLVTTINLDCNATGKEIEKDLQLFPDPNAGGKPESVAFSFQEYGKSNAPFPSPDYSSSLRKGHPGETYLDAPTAIERALKEGLTIEMDNIYYDLDQSAIRPDAAVELDKVAALMHRHPNLHVELRSHTDSRADDGYNQELSQRRAIEALRYLSQHGISANRIEVKGYGESWLLNECSNGVPCSESDHQMNRRTEIKIYNR